MWFDHEGLEPVGRQVHGHEHQEESNHEEKPSEEQKLLLVTAEMYSACHSSSALEELGVVDCSIYYLIAS